MWMEDRKSILSRIELFPLSLHPFFLSLFKVFFFFQFNQIAVEKNFTEVAYTLEIFASGVQLWKHNG